MSAPFATMRWRDVRPWENAVPVLDLAIVAGDFSDAQSLEEDAIEWAALPDHVRIRPGMFIARIHGESMNRRVANDSWVLFEADPAGSRQGRMVLVERNELGDAEDAGRYTLKVYDACKVETDDGIAYRSVALRPDSTDPRYRSIEIDLDDPDRPRIIAIVLMPLV